VFRSAKRFRNFLFSVLRARAYAVEAARLIKSNPHSLIEVEDLKSGVATAVARSPSFVSHASLCHACTATTAGAAGIAGQLSTSCSGSPTAWPRRHARPSLAVAPQDARCGRLSAPSD
jgi:hypothetical protein